MFVLINKFYSQKMQLKFESDEIALHVHINKVG